jgi:protein-disulfide isomerase
MKPGVIVIATAALLLAAFVAASALYQRAQNTAAAQRASAHQDSLIRPHAPVYGDPAAPVTIVEFFDPACATCQAFYAPLKELIDAHPGRLRLVLRYAPFQIGAEHIVALLEAARRQGKLWETLDILMESQDDWKPLHEAELARVWRHLQGLDLDLERLRREMADPEIAARIELDEADAGRLKVERTPTFFVNGQPLPGFGFGVLQQAVEAALQQR